MKWSDCTKIFFLVLILVQSIGCSSVRPLPSPHRGFFDRGSDSDSYQPRHKSFYSSLTQTHLRRRRGRFAAPRVEHPFSFKWPLETIEVTSSFGKRGRSYHEGIDLRAKVGTPVYAAQTGIVLYADSRIGGYGKMIVVRHDGQVATIYAHNSKILVRRGDVVKQGQKIAYSGNTGRSTGPHLHFEVRRGMEAVNPLSLMPRLANHRRVRSAALYASSR